MPHPPRNYKSYKQCQVGNGETSQDVYVPVDFARLNRRVRVLKDSVGSPSESFDPEEWEFWTIESVGDMVLVGTLTTDQKQQVKVER